MTPAVHEQSQLIAAFSELFGEPDDLWIYQGGDWRQGIVPTSSAAEQSAGRRLMISPLTLPQQPERLRLPMVSQVAEHTYLIGARLPVSDGDSIEEPPIVWATVRSNPAALMENMLRQSSQRQRLEREMADFHSGLQPHLEQISHDFEELVWLRNICGHMAACDASESLTSLAGRILPELRLLLKAEAIVVIHSSLEEAVTSVGEAQLASCWIGERRAQDQVLLDLIRSLDESGAHGLIVRNDLADECVPWRHAGLRSCILSPIRHGSSLYGWMLAVNRIPWRARSDRPAQAVPTTQSDDDFGTGDASLMGSAAAALGAHARDVDLLRQKEHMLIGTIRTLINALDAKDSYTCGHSERVALYAKSIAQQLGLSPQAAERIYVAGLLHDIGKIGVPDQVLLKPDRLTEQEFSVVQQHPVIGHNILKHIPQLERVLPGVLHHHESFDGRGYPHRLRGEAIPLDGRILAVADAYDAMTSARPYRSGMPAERAEAILRNGSGTQWDATVVEAFLTAKPQVHQADTSPVNFDRTNLETSESPGKTWHDVELEAGLEEVGETR